MNDYAPTESLCCWKTGGKQIIMWAAEGAVKFQLVERVACNVKACVKGREYDSTSLSVWLFPQIKVAPRIG